MCAAGPPNAVNPSRSAKCKTSSVRDFGGMGAMLTRLEGRVGQALVIDERQLKTVRTLSQGMRCGDLEEL